MDNEELRRLIDRLDALDQEREITALSALHLLKQVDKEAWVLATDIFDQEQQAAGWLSDDIPVLGNRMPFRLLAEGKRDEVIDCLYRIQYGFFA